MHKRDLDIEYSIMNIENILPSHSMYAHLNCKSYSLLYSEYGWYMMYISVKQMHDNLFHAKNPQMRRLIILPQ